MPKYNTDLDINKKIKSTSDENQCWEWTGTKNKSGYGLAYQGGKEWLAHRLVYFKATDTLPEAVCHTCDNPLCCNPKHLVGADRLYNNRDRHKKGRSKAPKGIDNAKAKLTDDQVVEIRRLYTGKIVYQKQLATMFGISQAAVSDIVNGYSWKHVPS